MNFFVSAIVVFLFFLSVVGPAKAGPTTPPAPPPVPVYVPRPQIEIINVPIRVRVNSCPSLPTPRGGHVESATASSATSATNSEAATMIQRLQRFYPPVTVLNEREMKEIIAAFEVILGGERTVTVEKTIVSKYGGCSTDYVIIDGNDDVVVTISLNGSARCYGTWRRGTKFKPYAPDPQAILERLKKLDDVIPLSDEEMRNTHAP